MKRDIVLVIGSNGQLGSVLTKELQKIHGNSNVIASDVYLDPNFEGVFELLDATYITSIRTIVKKYFKACRNFRQAFFHYTKSRKRQYEQD